MQLAPPEQFAAAVGIGIRAAQIAFRNATEGKPWRGYTLPVIEVPGNRGGAAGKVLALAVDRCPAELKAKLGAVEGPIEAPVQRSLKGAVAGWQLDEQADRLRIIAPIMDTPKRTAERAAAFRAVAAKMHLVRGVPTQLAEKTLRGWVQLLETQGPPGLVPVSRSDKGAPRVLITREWDAGIDLPIDRRARIVDRVTREARSMVFNDGTSVREALRLAGDVLCRLCLEAGSRLPAPLLRGLCQLNSKWAARIDLERYRLGYLKHKDHKRWQDEAVGRVNMALADTPMSLLQGDVHYADILVADGAEPIRLRLVAWLDDGPVTYLCRRCGKGALRGGQSMLEARGMERSATAEAQIAAKVESACREGYITPAMKDWALALCRSDEAAFDTFMTKAGPAWGYLLKETHTRGTPPGVAAAVPASDLERAVCEQLGLKPGSLGT